MSRGIEYKKIINLLTGNYLFPMTHGSIVVDDNGNQWSERGAQVNTLESVELNGSELDITDKKISLSLSIAEKATPNPGCTATYQLLINGDAVGDDIDIPTSSGAGIDSVTLNTVTAADKATGGKFENDANYAIGDPYLDFELSDNTHLYTNVKTYTAGNGLLLSNGVFSIDNSIVAMQTDLPTDYAKQGTNTSATLSDTQGAVKNGTTTVLAELLNSTYGLAALQTLVSAISGYALQGSDSTATNTAIKSAIATLATAVAAIPTNPATSTDVSNAQTAIIGAMPSVSGLASEASVKDGNDTAISLLKDGSVGLAAIKALVQAISGYALQGSDPTATNTAILSAILSNAGTPQLTIPNTTATQELASNTVYLFESRTNNLTLTLGTPIAGQNNEYHFFVFVGATVPSITYPSGISWNGGSAPTITANKNYEISINNNIAAYFEI